jgi:hypothetical protein
VGCSMYVVRECNRDPANLTEGVIVVQLQDEHLSDHLEGR